MASDDLWIFAYGSLMWEPGFACVERRAAWLAGFHRSLCIQSWHYRGTKAQPGLVFGLDRGGSCRGLALRIARDEREAILARVRARELVTGVYREVMAPIRFRPRGPAEVRAVAFVADRTHPQYAGRLPLEVQARLIAVARGSAGDNRAYLVSTLAHLEALGVPCAPLTELLAAVDRLGGC